MKSKDRDVELLFEVGTLRHLKRAWSQFGGSPFANVSEHSFRVLWIALLLAQSERHVDVSRVLKMAMIHDLVETRTGDRNYVQRQYTRTQETLAIEDSLHQTCLAKELLQLWEDYERGESLESKLVKDADNLDCDLELCEMAASGSRLPGLLSETRNRVATRLLTERAKVLFHEIRGADPHAWHLTGRNRMTDGDWREGTIDERDDAL